MSAFIEHDGGILSFNDWMLSESLSPKQIDFGTNEALNNKESRRFSSGTVVTFFKHDNRFYFVGVMGDGTIGFGVNDTFNDDIFAYNADKVGVSSASKVFGYVMYILSYITVGKKTLKFEGEHKQLDKFYAKLMHNKYFIKTVDSMGFKISSNGDEWHLVRKYWSCFLPWRENKLVSDRTVSYCDGYIIDKHDGERIDTQFSIKRYQSSKGVGWFSWLKYFTEDEVQFRLRMDYDSEVGGNKGVGWKGGTLGVSIPLGSELTDEAVQSAVQRAGVYAFPE